MKQERTLKILFLAANPQETERLRLDEEIRSIDEVLRKTEFRDQFEIVQHWAVRVDDLQECLLRHKPHLVHFSGHGSGANGIKLDNRDGGSHLVSTLALSRVFELLKDNIRCVVLNACYSAEQAGAIAEHVDAVVGMSQAVGDKAAIAFATAFYRALGYGCDLKSAFELGCSEIDLKRLAGKNIPQLKTRTGIDPQQIVFVTSSPTEVITTPQELLQAYRDHLTPRVSTVRIFGEAETRLLEKVFVELTLTEEYERPTANAQWLGMMDMELRRRRDIFARDDEDRKSGSPENERKKEKRTLKPDKLLHRKTQAAILGAPGCGKTTLLRYLALKTLQAGKRFPIFLELKSLSEKTFETAEGNLVELLFAKAVSAPLGLSAAEAERLKAFFLARLKAGEVTIFLDGLDEVAGAVFFNALCRSVNEFMASAYRHNDLIISTRPYALQHRFEGMQEMEIASLSPLQVEAFLQHYYGDDLGIKKLQQELLRRRELSELAQSPFLLNVIAHLYCQQGEIVGERLELYRRLVQLLVTQLDREKNVERFEVKDPDGALKRDFLKQLAYERLFADEVEKDSERLILTGETIAAKARIYCQTHHVANPHLLAADAKATPLLREIGADAYAFSHLTLQEYLAASALAEQPDCEKIFCRDYFNPTLAEMEVLPMALGFVSEPNSLYEILEKLPESLTFTNLRLRARGLGYARKIGESHLAILIEKLIESIDEQNREIIPYSDVIRFSFSAANVKVLDFIVKQVAHFLLTNYKKLNHSPGIDDILLFFRHLNTAERLENIFVSALQSADVEMRRNAVQMVRAWSNGITEALLRSLWDADHIVRMNAVEALKWKAKEKRVTDSLLIALRDRNRTVRMCAAKALANQGEGAVDGLLAALNDTDTGVRMAAIESLVTIGGKHALQGLLLALKEVSPWLREKAVEKLGEIGGENAVENILVALKDPNSSVRLAAIKALEKIGGERVVHALLVAARDAEMDVCWQAITTLIKIGGKEVEDGLLGVLKSSNKNARLGAIDALRKIGGERVMEGLLDALKDSNRDVRWQATGALEEIGGKQIEEGLFAHLLSGNKDVGVHVVRALSKIGGNRTVEALLPALQNENHEIRRDAAPVLGEIGDERVVDGLLAALMDGDRLVCGAAFDALVKIGGQQVIEKLLAALKDGDMRWTAAHALEKIGGEQVIAGLRARMLEENEDMHQCVVLTLGMLGDEQVVNDLFSSLRDSDSLRRWMAIDALVKIGGARSLEKLLVELQDVNSPVRALAAFALGQIGGDRAMNGLLAAIKDKDYFVRRNAASALGEIDHERAREVLIVALQDKNDEVRREAARALLKLGDLRTMDVFALALQDDDYDVRMQAVIALEKVNDERAIELLLHALKDEYSSVREKAAQALVKVGDKSAMEGMLVALQDYDREVRKYAAQALAKFGDARAIDGLSEALHDREREIRKHAIEALGKIGDTRAVKPLLASIYQWAHDEANPSRIAIQALLEINGENAVSELLSAFQDEDYGIRSNAAAMLERLDKTVLANGLKKALSHKESFVRQQAARAIGYYTRDKQLLVILNQLAKKDRSKKVKIVSREAAEKYANKLRYFAS